MHREIKVGLFFLVVVAMVIGGIQFLKGRGILHIDQEFVVYYDNVRGLAPSDDVVVNGLVVGKISTLELEEHDGETKVKVTFTLDNSIEMTDGSQAKLVGPDFLGETHIDLMLKQGNAALPSGSTIEALYDVTIFDELSTVSQDIDPILQHADSLLVNVNKLFASTITASDVTLNALVTDIDRLVNTYDTLGQQTNRMLEGKGDQIGEVLMNLNSITLNLKSQTEVLSGILENVDTLTTSLARVDFENTVNRLDDALISVHTLIDTIQYGEGSLHKLISEDTLHQELLSAVQSLDALLLDLKENPSRYVSFSLIERKDRRK